MASSRSAKDANESIRDKRDPRGCTHRELPLPAKAPGS